MVRTEHDIVQLVYAAKTDPAAADALVQQYLPFVRSETVKFTHAAIEAGHEDALSVALLAFYEAILSYERSRGAFVPYAARAIRNRLIDQYRAERRHRGHVSLQAPSGTDDRDLEQTLPEKENPVEASELRLASRREIEEFGAQLAEFGISFFRRGGQLPQAGPHPGCLPPGPGLCPHGAGPAGTPGADSPPAGGRTDSRQRCGQKDHRASPPVSGGDPSGLYQRL